MDILKHKKFQAALVSSLVIFLGQYLPSMAGGGAWQGLALVDWALVTAPIMVAIGAQGIADFGKEAKKIENGNLNKSAK